MALKVYASADPSTSFSEDSTFTNPISYSVDGVSGGTLTRKFYVRNNDLTKFYVDISIAAVVNSGLMITDGSVRSFYWKLFNSDTAPLESQWDLINANNTIELNDIGSSGNADIATYLPFWLRINVPKNTEIQSFENVSLVITATETIA